MVYDISYKTLFSSKPLCIRYDEVDRFIKVYDGMRYLVLFAPEKHDTISNRIIRYLISQKSDITYVFYYNYGKTKIDSYNSLPLEETLTLHNVIILIKDKNHCYYNILLKKCSYR